LLVKRRRPDGVNRPAVFALSGVITPAANTCCQAITRKPSNTYDDTDDAAMSPPDGARVLIVERSKLTKNFAQIPNELVFDERLSALARLVLIQMLAHRPGWQTNAAKLWETADRHRGEQAESKRAFRRAFAELEAAGYMTREKARVPKGQPNGGDFVTILTVHDTPKR
jgi:hypothetical protein